MHYMLFLCDDGSHTTTGGTRLRPAAEAVTVRVRDGRTLVTPGPADAAYERVTAFEVVDCPDLDVAIEVAGNHPAGRQAVEIRPFWED